MHYDIMLKLPRIYFRRILKNVATLSAQYVPRDMAERFIHMQDSELTNIWELWTVIKKTMLKKTL